MVASCFWLVHATGLTSVLWLQHSQGYLAIHCRFLCFFSLLGWLCVSHIPQQGIILASFCQYGDRSPSDCEDMIGLHVKVAAPLWWALCSVSPGHNLLSGGCCQTDRSIRVALLAGGGCRGARVHCRDCHCGQSTAEGL